MTDLVTTTQSAVREASITTYFAAKRTVEKLAERAKDPTGQTAAEYVGILLLVGVIIAAIVALNLPEKISTAVSNAIDKILSADGGSGGGGGGGPQPTGD